MEDMPASSGVPYPVNHFEHIEGGEYEFTSDELGPGRVERAGSLGQQLEAQYEEEQAVAASPPKMLPAPIHAMMQQKQQQQQTTEAQTNNPPAQEENREQKMVQEMERARLAAEAAVKEGEGKGKVGAE